MTKEEFSKILSEYEIPNLDIDQTWEMRPTDDINEAVLREVLESIVDITKGTRLVLDEQIKQANAKKC